MQVRQVMTPNTAAVDAGASVAHAILAMMDDDLGWLPATDNGKVVGVLSFADLVIRTFCDGLDPDHARLSGIMSPGPPTCTADALIEDAAHMMGQAQWLLVVDSDNKPSGVVFAGALAEQLPERGLPGDGSCKVSCGKAR